MSAIVDVTKLPMAYRCLGCDAEGVRLWRDYSTFLSHITLKCRACTEAEQGPQDATLPKSDAIGWRVPAVPDDTGTFWGYTSVPDGACAWWRALPETEGGMSWENILSSALFSWVLVSCWGVLRRRREAEAQRWAERRIELRWWNRKRRST